MIKPESIITITIFLALITAITHYIIYRVIDVIREENEEKGRKTKLSKSEKLFFFYVFPSLFLFNSFYFIFRAYIWMLTIFSADFLVIFLIAIILSWILSPSAIKATYKIICAIAELLRIYTYTIIGALFVILFLSLTILGFGYYFLYLAILTIIVILPYCYIIHSIGVTIGHILRPSNVGKINCVKNIIAIMAQTGSILAAPFLLANSLNQLGIEYALTVLVVYYAFPSALVICQNAILTPKTLNEMLADILLKKITERRNRILLIGTEVELLLDIASRVEIAELILAKSRNLVEPIYVPMIDGLSRIHNFASNITIITTDIPRSLVIASEFEYGKIGLAKILISPSTAILVPIIIVEKKEELASQELLLEYLNIQEAEMVFLITRKEEIKKEETQLYELFRVLIKTLPTRTKIFMAAPRSYILPSAIAIGEA